jgi:hypothetical protein
MSFHPPLGGKQSRIMKESHAPIPTIHARLWQAACFRQLTMWMIPAALSFSLQAVCAQTPANVPASRLSPDHKVAQHRKGSPARAAVPAPAPDLTPAPPVPEPPKWPMNDAPTAPSIRWDSQGLKVDATNSSLRQILDDVSTTTGTKVEGLGADERVFGIYGPGPARDVLSQILNGSSYNVLMLGDEGEGTPREIVLSQRTKAGPQPGQGVNRPTQQDEDTEPPEAEEPNQQPPINRPNMGQPVQPGGPMTPQQRMLEMQRQQMQMQQQQQQQQNPPIQPPPQPPQ